MFTTSLTSPSAIRWTVTVDDSTTRTFSMLLSAARAEERQRAR